jgi:DHA2 family multidrug resistance protein
MAASARDEGDLHATGDGENGDPMSAGPAPFVRLDRLVATIALMLATAMQAADATIVNVALPQLERDLGGGITLGAWVMTSYLCATAVMAPLTGWLRRRYGARLLFPGGIGLFVVASLLCALAPSPAAIISSRILQGTAGGIIHPLGQAILLDLYPTERHGRMLAIWGSAIMIGPILGPVLGGIITDAVSWRWVFVINLPLGLAAIWGMRRALPRGEVLSKTSIDAVGIFVLMASVASLQLCLSRGVGRSWLQSPDLLTEAAMTILGFSLLAVRARTAGFTVLRLAVFKDLHFAAAAFFNFTTSALLFVAIVFLPALGEGPLGYDATLAGFTIMPRGILMVLMMLLAGRLIGKLDYRILLATGLLLMAAGLLMLSNIQPAYGVPWIIVGSTIQAMGAGLLLTPLSTLAFSTLPPEMRTDAAGVYSLLRQLGFASGIALMTAVLHLRIEVNLIALSAPVGGTESHADIATLRAYADCFKMMAIATMVVGPGIFLFRSGRVRQAVSAD